MARVDLRDPSTVHDPEGFRRLGALLGARRLGTTVDELRPGRAIHPRHHEDA